MVLPSDYRFKAETVGLANAKLANRIVPGINRPGTIFEESEFGVVRFPGIQTSVDNCFRIRISGKLSEIVVYENAADAVKILNRLVSV